jgi:hypothetical protein
MFKSLFSRRHHLPKSTLCECITGASLERHLKSEFGKVEPRAFAVTTHLLAFDKRFAPIGTVQSLDVWGADTASNAYKVAALVTHLAVASRDVAALANAAAAMSAVLSDSSQLPSKPKTQPSSEWPDVYGSDLPPGDCGWPNVYEGAA